MTNWFRFAALLSCIAFLSCIALISAGPVFAEKPAENAVAEYTAIVLSDQPVAYWSMNDEKLRGAVLPRLDDRVFNQPSLEVTAVGRAEAAGEGPNPPFFPLFAAGNRAIRLDGSTGYLRIADPGDNSPLDFDHGDSLTLEAWVNPKSIASGRFAYVIGKGRTQNAGFPADNQNYALRLQGSGGAAAISFLFHSRGDGADWHRWTSKEVLGVGDGWHHIAVTYTFGKKDSVRGYIDGEPVAGVWDMGGATERAPVVDDDEVWIGSSMGGAASSSFHGSLDEIAIYRQALPADRIAARFRYVESAPEIDLTRVPDHGVLVDIFEGIPDKKTWEFRAPQLTESYVTQGFGFIEVPNKYSDRGIKVDRSSPFMIRAMGTVTIPAGKQRILVRCRNASRLYLDDRKIAETKFFAINGNAHGTVFPIDTSLAPNIRPLQRGDTQCVAEIVGDGQPHVFRFEMIVGGQKHRPEFGETAVCIASPDGDFRLLSETLRFELTDQQWPAFMEHQREFVADLNAQRRRQTGVKEAEYWQRRHALARQAIADLPPISPPEAETDTDFPAHNAVDRFINSDLREAGQVPTPLVDDWAFLRRVSLDVLGIIPTPELIDTFFGYPKAERRARIIDDLLQHPRWADNWVGYWQDALAENPNLVNPTLNNTGPFRWWIHESFLDNKPFDRFVTELIMMQGSAYYGGPAGFGMATQNDVPMAAKAHIVGQAFLAVQMKCARCHDAPYHDLKQSDLFSMAAMLNRGPQAVPATSTIPGGPAATESLLVEVTLKPGTKVAPQWTFDEIVQPVFPDGVLRMKDDSREQLAALITLPGNQRFAQVIVNRLWKRYLGHGLVEPVDDWEHATVREGGLLDYLAREFAGNGYDLKHVARLILNSYAYQRAARSTEILREERPYRFASPLVRRMTAEQLVDSLFVACGKPFDSDPMCIDIDGARQYSQSLNLSDPTRAWQFTSLANERDRPSLALPFAQPFVTTLEAFGWRGSRQDPISQRDNEPTALQPAILANGLLARRIWRLSDDNAFTELALRKQPVEELVHAVYQRLLCREPSASELATFVELLQPGYEQRVVQDPPPPAPRPRLRRNMVSWSNHLDPEANIIKVELQEAVRRGDPPTNRLETTWRERMEDGIWTLTNSPEFVFLP